MGFLAPWFLGGLAALGVPVFVHLLRRHKATPRPVSSLMFFERGTQSSTRHRRLRYLVLFALRCALVLLVVLAFANPYIWKATADANFRLLLIVLDHSFSMRARTRFGDAKQKALALLAGKPHGQKAQIMSLGGQLEVRTAAITDDAPLRAALENIQPGDGHASFGELGQAMRSLAETEPGPIELHLFSDMQRTAMPSNLSEVVLPNNVELVLHPVADGPAPANWTVESEDAFPADDTSVFAVRRSDPERVLFVHAADDARSALYFGSALSAATLGSFVLQSVAAEQTTDLDPTKYAFVVLSDAVTLPGIFEHTLGQYLAKGGRALIALGTSAGHHAQIPLWGGDVKDTHDYAREGGTVAVGQVDFSYPALDQARPGADNGGWGEVKVFYAAVPEPGQARVAARLSDATPLLLDKQVGEGHIVLLASGLENLTNDLPLHPIFVVFVDRMARYLSGDERLSGSKVVDSFAQLRGAAEPAGVAASVEVIDPDGHRPLSLNEARTMQSVRLERSGFYQIRFANGRDAVIGVNPDRRESNLEPLSKDVQDLWSGGSASSGTQPAGSAAVQVKARPVSLWWYVMLLALVVALAETALASGYLGTQREEA